MWASIMMAADGGMQAARTHARMCVRVRARMQGSTADWPFELIHDHDIDHAFVTVAVGPTTS